MGIATHRRNRSTHADGSRCLEGTRRVPRPFKPCCEIFAGHTTTCVFDIRYEWGPRSRQWGIAIDESAGGGWIVMYYCPHCGQRLEPTARKRRKARP